MNVDTSMVLKKGKFELLQLRNEIRDLWHNIIFLEEATMAYR